MIQERGTSTTGTARITKDSFPVRTMGWDRDDLGRMAMRFSSSASHDTEFINRSPFPCNLKYLLAARRELPATTMRALAVLTGSSSALVEGSVEPLVVFSPLPGSLFREGTLCVETAITEIGPFCPVFSSKLALPDLSCSSLIVHETGLVRARAWTVTLGIGFSAARTERTSGKKEARLKFLVMGKLI